MKIAVASSGLGHVNRGVESWAFDLGHGLARQGVDVLLLKGGGRPEAPFERVLWCLQRASQGTQRLRRLIPRSLGWRIGMGSDYEVEQLSFALAMLPHLRRNRIDILHVQDPLVALVVQRAFRLGLVDAKPILAHGTEEPLSFQRQVTYLQHLAPFHLEEARQASVWKPTWTAIPNFIDTERFRPGDGHAIRAELDLPEDAVVIITAAAIKKHHKRIDYLLKEFRTARDLAPGLPLYLVVSGGRESDTDELVSLGKELLGDSVRFLVQFPRERMAALYRAADFFVICSLKEMMPVALLEALATGLPSLVNQHPVLEWMIGKGGRSIDMEERGTLATEIVVLARDSDERKRLSSAARGHCLEFFSTERVLAKITEYYRFVMEDRSA